MPNTVTNLSKSLAEFLMPNFDTVGLLFLFAPLRDGRRLAGHLVANPLYRVLKAERA